MVYTKTVIRIVLLVILAVACTANGEEQKLLIGILYGDSARTSEEKHLDLLGARIELEELNSEGGILGRQIEFLQLNNHNNLINTIVAAEKAVEAGVVAVIGPSSSSHAILAGTVFQKAGIPMISSFATNPEVTRLGDYIFRVCFQDDQQGKILADFAANSLKAKTAVVLTCTEEIYSVGLAEIFMAHFRKNGGVILWEGEYLNTFTDFSELLAKAAKYEPAIIFLPGYDFASGLIIKQSRSMGLNIPFLGGDAWSNKLYEYGGTAIEGCYYSGPWYPELENETTLAFLERYKNGFKSEEIISFGLSRDALFLLADAIERAGSAEPSLIRHALADTKNFQGVTGNITMDRNGDPSKPIPIFKFENQDSVFIKMVTP